MIKTYELKFESALALSRDTQFGADIRSLTSITGLIGVSAEGLEVSDGYHTMSELYEHRHALFCALCNLIAQDNEGSSPLKFGHLNTWKSKLHNDGTMYEGWFIAGITGDNGDITYHLPLEWWEKFRVLEVGRAPEFTGYTSKDVLERLLKL